MDAFVRRLLAKEGKDNDDYMRYMQIACDGLRNMHIHDFSVSVTKVVTVNSTTNTFSFPADFVRYNWVATVLDGRWWTYTREDGMVPLQDDDGTTIQSSLPNITSYEYATNLGEAGARNNYYFKPDYKGRRFQVGGMTPDVVVLNYISNGIDSGGSIYIPDYALLALEGYVRWMRADYDDEAQSKIIRLEQQYIKSRRAMRAVRRPPMSDIKDVIYQTGALRR
jgi:hypothetical protein